jgi:hypothetical protein
VPDCDHPRNEYCADCEEQWKEAVLEQNAEFAEDRLYETPKTV